jgi:hypothetical protein
MANFPAGDYVMHPGRVITNLCVQLTYADPKGTYKVPVPKYSWVRAVETVTDAAVAGGSLQVGDSADADGYLSTADCAITAAATATTPAVKRAADLAQPYAAGKRYYAGDDNVIFDWDPASATSGQVTGTVDISYPQLAGIYS